MIHMKPKRFGSNLNCPVPQSMRKGIEQLADESQMSMSEIVRDLLTEGLKIRGKIC